MPRPVQLSPFLNFMIPLASEYKAHRVAQASTVPAEGTGYVLLTGVDRAQALELATIQQTACTSPVKKAVSSPFQEGEPIRTVALNAEGDPVVSTAFDFTVGIVYDEASGTEICEITRGGR